MTGNSLKISTKTIKNPVKIEGRISGKINLNKLFSKETPCNLPASSKFGEILCIPELIYPIPIALNLHI